ncbi:MAG: SUMF1/EgtB/PvdO family nonheme iron enzyme [Gammaproteobacteria bacterium]|nr:SUMF1/EgtB/PvdO family nonheme iron enzyme [Gammaproteobacteria bacterium]MBT7306611.1 SUMF1/EgtB/PvdO family nonheme iron enzyme [Gammaproteobacteria bacterium]
MRWDDGRSGQNRVNRGGSWNNNAKNLRSANRNNNSPSNRNNNLGVRLMSTKQCQMRWIYGSLSRA